MSLPGEIEDRTGFLLGQSKDNPAKSIARIVTLLARSGATVAGIPCNTAHAPQILEPLKKLLRLSSCKIKLLNLIDETVRYLSIVAPQAKSIGVISTTGTKRAGIYREALERAGLSVVELNEDQQEDLVQSAIYDRSYGIKAKSNPVTEVARSKINNAMKLLKRQGAEVIILGCTELPLAVSARMFESLPLIDPARALARALIAAVNRSKLRPLR
jgi:aspartate racemase